MNKKIIWPLWALGLISVNVFAVPFAIWSTFAGSEGMEFLWILISCLVLLIFNIGVLQTFGAIKKGQELFFWFGLLVVLLQTFGLYYMNVKTWGSDLDSYIIFGPIVISFVLLIMQNFWKKKA